MQIRFAHQGQVKVITKNKQAYYKYFIKEKFQAGICLKGFEVKAIKTGKISLKGSYVRVENREVFLKGANIPAYQPKNTPSGYNPTRARKLLLKKSEIKYLIGKTKEKGLTIAPLMVYTQKGKIKIEFGIVKQKSKPDKRESIKKRALEREIKRQLKQRG